MEEKLFFWFWNVSIKHRAVRRTAVFISQTSRQFFFIVYAASGVFLFYADNTRLVPYIAAPFALMCASLLLRRIVKRPRPRAVYGIEPAIDKEGAYACPSNHAASAAVIALACMYVCAPLGVFLCALTALTGASRLFAGAHRPLDIAAGWALGAAFGAAFLFF